MSDALYKQGQVTICVVNYKTEVLTRLCLRSIRRFTRTTPCRVVVVDNNSGDGSLEYLRSLPWIKLIERPGYVTGSGAWAHGSALDLGLEAADTEFFVSLHSDTFVHCDRWLEELIAACPPDIVCAGGGKLDLKPKWEVTLKRFTDVKEWLRRIRPNAPRNDFYIRTICAIYRTEAVMREDLRFMTGVAEGFTCGKQLYYRLLDRGYRANPLPPYTMARYIDHLAHATMVLNPEFTVRTRTEKKCRKQIERLLNSPLAQEIMNDDSLDR